jgi:signal transduction histidine kinase/CHASE1-domain containing sensor protein
MLVWSEVEARLVASTDRITASFRERMEAHGNNLIHLRSHFLPLAPSHEEFREIVSRIDLFARHPGTRGVGFAEIVPAARLGRFVRETSRSFPGYRVSPSGERGLYAPVTLLEPLDWINRQAVGFDLFSETRRRQAITAAVRSGEVALSDPVQLTQLSQPVQDPDKPSRDGFFLFLPVYRDGFRPGVTGEDPFDHVEGVIYATFRAGDFFEAAFGAPSLKQEAVNFVLASRGPGAEERVLYNRFDLNGEDTEVWAALERPVSIFGQNLILRVYPLQHFYSFADRYLALIVGLGAALVSCMVMVVMRVSQNQLEFETLAKESSIEAARQSRRQVENLRKLNEFDRMLAGELDMEVLTGKFSGAFSRLTGVDASFLFFKRSSDAALLHIREHSGIPEGELKCHLIQSAWVEKLVTQSLVLHKGDSGGQEVIGTLLAQPDRFSDWILSVISTREGGRCGLVFAARTIGPRFSEVDLELFESMVTQFASSIEIAQLFLRVEDASRAKNAFLANMSHEIRTPLSAIIGFSEMLTKEDISRDQRLNVAENLRKNGGQLTCIIDDILDLSKVEAGKMRISRARVSLSPLVHEIKSVMDLRARAKGISFLIETAGPIPMEIETDEVRLKQVLMNVLGNAIKFTDSGQVGLILRHIQGADEESFFAFTVKDTGIGISDDAQGELFKPFSQGDMSNTRRFGGSGLGLALSKRLAQELGGDVVLLQSIRGQGSIFEIRVSAGSLEGVGWTDALFPKAIPAEVGPLDAAPRLDGARILVVEDSEDNQEIFRYFLESSGAQAEIVGNGMEAVKNAVSRTYDMILMDIQIPGIDGKEATRRIRRQGFAKPIVALTAHAMPEEQESCLRAGCSGQITKPVSGEALVSQVAEFLRGA